MSAAFKAGESIPGFTDEQAWALRTVARQAAEETVAQLSSKPCGFNCEDMASVKGAVFGRTEAGVKGLDGRMDAAETTLAQLRRITWTAVSALIVSLIGLVFVLIQFAIIGPR